MDFKDLMARTPAGQPLPMSEYEGRTVLIVNTATKCGFAPQFSELEALHRKYKDSGLVILGFPCNQFSGQEPESNESMEKTCEINFGVSFQLTEKVSVNGSNTHPIYDWLKEELPGKWGKKIKWNFTKFLVGPNGKAFKRYGPAVKPSTMEEDIVSLLGTEVQIS